MLPVIVKYKQIHPSNFLVSSCLRISNGCPLIRVPPFSRHKDLSSELAQRVSIRIVIFVFQTRLRPVFAREDTVLLEIDVPESIACEMKSPEV